jgi:Ca2+-binding RTX toxin-like protein
MANITATSGIDLFDGIGNTTSGNDTLNAANGTANSGDVWNGGSGTDTLILTTNATNINLSVVTISGVEALVSSRRNDVITISLDDYREFSTISTGKGKDSLTILASGSLDVSASTLATLSGVEKVFLTGSAGNDTATLSGSQLDRFLTVSLGGGQDTLGITSTSAKLNVMSDASFTLVEAISAATAAAGVTIDMSLQSEALSITGSSSADTITGSRNKDTIAAGGGNDTIRVATGQFLAGETLGGGAGTDTIVLSSNGVTIDLSIGNISSIEKLNGSTGNDTVTLTSQQWSAMSAIDLSGGNDSLTTLVSGAVTFSDKPTIAGIEAARLVGTAGDETITATGLILDALASSGGNINLGLGTDTLSLLSTSSVLNSLGASDGAIAGLEIITAADAVSGVIISLLNQTESFSFTGSAGADDFTSGLGADTISGSLGDDVIKSGGGDDIVIGGAGADQLDGGSGNDTADYGNSSLGVKVDLKSGSGTGGDAQGDKLSAIENVVGSIAADRLTGDGFANTLNGGDGNDFIEGGAGADKLMGEAGLDTLGFAASLAGVIVSLKANTASGGDADGDTISGFENLIGSKFADKLTGSGGVNVINGGGGNDILSAAAGKDKLNGGSGNDSLNGGGGADILKGGSGADKFVGAGGSDKFYGGTGKDTYSGGKGSDVFFFKKIAEAGKGSSADSITDFVSKSDKINLSAIDADTNTSGNQDFVFIGKANFHDVAGEIRYDKATGTISGDVTGDGVADFMIKLTAGTALTGGDFIL